MSTETARVCVNCSRLKVTPSRPGGMDPEFGERLDDIPAVIECGIFAWRHRNDSDEVEDLRHNMLRARTCDSFDAVTK